MTLQEKIAQLPVLLPVLIAAATFHELAHAYVARVLGDRTAEMQGRLTLNPLKHLDPIGSGMFLFTFLFTSFPFGWARPVPVLPSNFKKPKEHMALVAVAGPVVNFLLGLAIFLAAVQFAPDDLSDFWINAINTAIFINVIFCVFNLFPVPPLDGSRIVGAFMSKDLYEKWSSLDQYAAVLFLVLIFVFRDPFFTIVEASAGLVFDIYTAIANVIV